MLTKTLIIIISENFVSSKWLGNYDIKSLLHTIYEAVINSIHQDLPHYIKLLWEQQHAIKRFKEESKILSQ